MIGFKIWKFKIWALRVLQILLILFSTLIQVSSNSLNKFSSVSWRSLISLYSSYITFPWISSIILNMVVYVSSLNYLEIILISLLILPFFRRGAFHGTSLFLHLVSLLIFNCYHLSFYFQGQFLLVVYQFILQRSLNTYLHPLLSLSFPLLNQVLMKRVSHQPS